MKYVVDFFHKIFDSAKEKRFDCSFRNLGMQKFLQTLKMTLTLGRSKKGEKAEKRRKKAKKSKKWILPKNKATGKI